MDGRNDLGRWFAAYSAGERSGFLSLTLLLASSGKSLNNVPFVMQAPGLIDVTDEILQELSR